MNARIREKIERKINKGRIMALLDNDNSVKDITERLWLMIKLAKKLHWISHDHYFANTKMQAFATSIFNKHTTKRDVYKYVKKVRDNVHIVCVIYKPCHANTKKPKTWTCVKLSNHSCRFINSLINQLDFGREFLFGQANAYYNLSDYKKYLKRVEYGVKKYRKQAKAKKRAEA